ncbi:helix-turn-helix transcriptional regulator [uncultured Dysosmobacter sp.]|uniref:helix-turn-helix domain-containing protein n=1 Tax=uncultured Dysosmobacter sp. TaxID=2591384 RepID=UPI002634731C|nr:helix-turn-helix transcriptional regulator [uncultured Dysosmobacter sp.]
MERIQNLRKKAGVSQTYIAELLKVGQKTYSDYELGKSRIPLESMIILAKYYNVSMDYICGVSDIPNPFPRK